MSTFFAKAWKAFRDCWNSLDRVAKGFLVVVGIGLPGTLGIASCIHSPYGRFTFQTVIRLHDGQTYDEVVAILGIPDHHELRYRTEPISNHSKFVIVADWEGPSNGIYRKPSIEVTFSDGLIAGIYIEGISAPKP